MNVVIPEQLLYCEPPRLGRLVFFGLMIALQNKVYALVAIIISTVGHKIHHSATLDNMQKQRAEKNELIWIRV